MATYQGGCHCGTVRYEADGEIASALQCNCSFCSKTGALLAFVPAATFRLTGGEGSLRDYQFNRRVIHHQFCAECGVRPFSRGALPDGTPMIALNLRCVDGLDVAALPVHQHNGADA
ncbi:GFA family protein [Muricoccus radiodurans]|uniref:GFA family protein n=1 Tax=Muricoccus radiodurans TaxID=2231721 RepID=UPI003CEE5B6D